MPSTNAKATNIIFVRHGVTPKTGILMYGQSKGNHLSEFGVAQAQRAAERVKQIVGGRAVPIISSPLERAHETAKPIAKALRQKIKLDSRLLEMDTGSFTNKKLSTIMSSKDGQHIRDNPATYRFPRGESFADLYARVFDLISDVQTQHNGKTVVFVTHGDIIKVAIADALGVGLSQFQKVNAMPASVSIISYFNRQPLLQCVNDTSHLDDLKQK